MLVFIAPTVALAANTATFSSVTPASGSYSMATAPKVSVIAHDKYGAKGAGAYSMTIDGVKVPAIMSYVVVGSWNPRHPDYSKFKVSYQVPRSLSVGTHTVVVKVHDLKNKNSTYTWKFNVDAASTPVTFSSLFPTEGGSAQISKPKLSATIASRWDVKGTGAFSMTLDGVKVGASMSYTSSGNYRTFRVTYQVPATLTPTAHSITVNVHDAAGRNTARTWTFTVIPPDPVYAEMPVAGATCADCHTGYPAAHPMTNCEACHGAGAPPRPAGSRFTGTPMIDYVPSWQSVHVAGSICSLNCHGHTEPTIHVLDSDCTRCHNPNFPTIPQAHAVDANAIRGLHASTASFCTQKFCHATSLTAEHYRRTDSAGASLSCGTCHGSTDPLVVAAIAGKLTSCQSCHPFGKLVHPDTSTAHAASGYCVQVGCHVADVTLIHKKNCDACHDGTKPLSATCTDCHGNGLPAGPYHVAQATAHTLTLNTCVATGCHGVGLGMDAANTHKGNCFDCHGSPNGPSLVCTACHTKSLLALHASQDATHAAPAVFCTGSNCHDSGNVAAIHVKDGVYKCTACHADGKTPSTDCLNTLCHAGQLDAHPGAADAHRLINSPCNASGCHALTDVALLHANTPLGCANCHKTGWTPTLDCSACHVGDTTTFHATFAGNNHFSQNTSCVKANCHSSDLTANHTTCARCHFQTTTPTSNCQSCHIKPLAELHTSADASHTVPVAGGCFGLPGDCHATNVSQIHSGQPSSGCMLCHGVDGKPSTTCANCHTTTLTQQHDFAINFHLSTYGGGCLLPGCHDADVTVTHFKNGAPRCIACHDGKHTPSTTCSDCHAGDIPSLHPTAASSHTAPIGVTCVAPACHVSDISLIHAGSSSSCRACHDGVNQPTNVCGTDRCHPEPFASLHSNGNVKHNSPQGSCVTPTCHDYYVPTIHDGKPGDHDSPAPSCLACHAPGQTAGVTCTAVGCHPGNIVPRHAGLIGDSHTARPSAEPTTGTCVQTGCHGNGGSIDVAAIHDTSVGGPGCAACHGANKVATLDCTNGCHAGTFGQLHAPGNTAHSSQHTPCSSGGGGVCHDTNAATVHTNLGARRCAVCHDGTHPLTVTCTDCHTGDFWSVGVHNVGSGAETSHTPAPGTCVSSTCHNTDVTTIHPRTLPTDPGCMCHRLGPLTLDCTTAGCHTQHVPERHDAAIAAADTTHTAPAGVCVNSGCHGSDAGDNLALQHIATVKSCAACHSDTATPSFTCTASGCHNTDPLVFHKQVGTKHDVPAGTCVATGCHGTDAGANVVTLHAKALGCATCHGPGITASTTCDSTGCHASTPGAEHVKFLGTGHASLHRSEISCNNPAVGCHSTDVSTIHGTGNCQVCHSSDTPVKTCDTCHDGGTTAIHATHGDAAHAVVTGSCVSSTCHDQPVNLVHGGSTCIQCHPAGAGPATTKVCSDCHVDSTLPTPDSTPTPHPTATAADSTHTVPLTGCTRSGCHDTNVAKLHFTPTSNHPTPPGCMACHGNPDHAATTDCSVCHANADHTAFHELTVARTDTCQSANCHPGTNLVPIHVGGCGLCHDSTDPNVVAAIGNGSKTCDTCHNFTDHTALHDLTLPRTDTCQNVGCHTGINLLPIHKNTCSTCHSDTVRNAVKDAIAAHDRTCGACHAFSDHTALHDEPFPRADTCVSADCHPGTNLFPIHKNSCATCHDPGVRKAVQDAIANNQVICSACHAFTDHTALHDVTRTDTCSGVACHNGTNLSTIVSGRTAIVAHTSCATCHQSQRQAVKDAIANSTPTCAACHFSDFAASHVTPTLDHTAPANGCLTTGGGCHSNDTIALHAPSTSKCNACHANPDGNAASFICANCHKFADHTSQHVIATPRTDGCDDVACHAGTNLLTINKSAGVPSPKHALCDTCHKSTDPNVIAAIAGHNKACGACHSTTDHITKHATTVPADCSGGPGCHNGTNLISIKTGTSTVNVHAACATCHTSTRPDVIAAIAAHNLACSGCHSAAHQASHQWCNDCHASAYNDSGYHDPSLIPDRGCASCHGTTFTTLNGSTWVTGQYHCGASCHGYGFGAPTNDLHAVTRTDTCAASGCHDATKTNLTLLHASCAECHSSTDPIVIAAIAANNKDCANCHGFSDHITQHAVTRTDTCAASGCHDSTKVNLTTVHKTCDECHKSTDPAVVAAIAAKNHSCSNCHGFSDHISQHAVTRTDICAGAGCHVASNANLTTLHPTCATCHDSTVPAVVAAIAGHNKACTACHGTDVSAASLHPNYTTMHNTSSSGCTGTYCHPSTAVSIHGRTGCVDSCHKNPVASLTLTCASCHSGVNASQHISAYHSDCNACHADYDSWGHDGGSGPQIDTSYPCYYCHSNPGSPGALQSGYYHGSEPLQGCDSWNCH
jgi:hypothetical protein